MSSTGYNSSQSGKNSTKPNESATLTLHNRRLEYPVLPGTIGMLTFARAHAIQATVVASGKTWSGTDLVSASTPADELPTPPEGIVLAHFIVSDDVERSRRFYTDVLGGRDAFSGPGGLTYVKLSNSWIIINVGGGPTEMANVWVSSF